MEDERQSQRRSIRLRDFDYASGAVYFVTICAHERRCIFGRVEDGQSRLNRLGRIVEDAWLQSLELRRYFDLDAYVIMPNHVHGIAVFYHQEEPHPAIVKPPPSISLSGACIAAQQPKSPAEGKEGARSAPLRTYGLGDGMKGRSLGSFIAGFKSTVTRRVQIELPRLRLPIWQRNYYEHIVRNNRDLERIRNYIAGNPARWEEDGYHPRFMRRQGAHSAPLRSR